MKYKLEKIHWKKAKQDNINLILQCEMQILMAEKIIELIDTKIAEFQKKD